MKFEIKKSILFPLVLLLLSAVFAQIKDDSEKQIQFYVSVWTSKKGYLKDLTQKDFEVYSENELQKIEFSPPEDKPLTVGVLFDLSQSMQTDRKKFSKTSMVAEAFKTFLKNGNAVNEYFFVTFGREKSLSLDLTQDQDRIQKALDEILKSKVNEPNTLLFDALKLAYEKFSTGRHSRKILFLVTDGFDNDSESKFKEIKNLFRQENIPIYFLNVLDRSDFYGVEEFFSFMRTPLLERNPIRTASVMDTVRDVELLSYDTGGRVFFPVDSKESSTVFELIAEELKSQYSVRLTLKPDPTKKDERRKLDVKLAMPKEKQKELGKIMVKTRRDYYIKTP